MDLSGFYFAFSNLIESLPENTESQPLKTMLDELQSFLQQIGEADRKDVNKILREFESDDEIPLFKEVGKLLRKFHDQLSLIREDIPENLGRFANRDASEMSSKLQMIISMTDKAANTTLDLAEETLDELSRQKESYSEIVGNLNSISEKEETPPGFSGAIKQIISRVEAIAEANGHLEEKMTNILIAQDYQDLTGQVIHKMINLIRTLEEDLSFLIKKFGHTIKEVENVEQISLKGPLDDENGDKKNQDDVDSLLSEFGF